PCARVATGSLGCARLLLWCPLSAPPGSRRSVSAGGIAYIQSDPPDRVVQVPWLKLIPYRQTWAFSVAKGLTDPVWWLYLFWIPDFLFKQYAIDLKSLALPLIVIYQLATVGSVGGGWLSSSLIRRGWSVNRSRK